MTIFIKQRQNHGHAWGRKKEWTSYNKEIHPGVQRIRRGIQDLSRQ